MAGTKNSNKKAKMNGNITEEIIHNLLLNSTNLVIDKSIQGTIDFVINGKYVEVKSCQVIVNSSEKKEPHRMRTGRFILENEQHKELLNVDGYYLFVIFHNNMILDYRLIKSKYIKYRRVITWGTIWRNEYITKTRMDELTTNIRNTLSDNSN